MMKSRAVRFLAAWAILTPLTVSGALAQLQTLTLDPVSGPAGAVVLAEGDGFELSPCGVNLHLDSTDNPSLGFASTDGGVFSTSIAIPEDASPGNHVIVAQGLLFSGEFCGEPSGELARAPFFVTETDPDTLDLNVHLRTRTIPSECGVDPDFLAAIRASATPLHGIVQLRQLPRREEEGPNGPAAVAQGDLSDLQALGITLLRYLNGREGLGVAYLASISPDVMADNPAFDELVRCLLPLEPDDKLEPGVDAPGDPRSILILAFEDVSDAAVRELLGGLGLESDPFAPGLWRTMASPDQIRSLAGADAVQWIEAGPLEFLPTVDEVRAESDVDDVQDLNTASGIYGGLSGSGVQVAIMDSGVDTSHDDFAGRFVRTQDDGGDHGSHVAGIAVGSGARSDQSDDAAVPNGGTAFQWRGMAPEAGISAFGGAGGNTANYNAAINTDGVDVSNHSYVLQVQNQYNASVASVDAIVRGDSPGIPARPAVWAAANNASVGPRDCDNDGVPDGNFPQYPGGCPTAFQAGYFSVLSPCKNCLGVASVDKSLVHSFFSSMGPTSDGRLKPEISAIGRGVFSVGADTNGDGTAVTGNGYRNKSGTSMAAPAVTGIAALMLEQYALTFGVSLDLAPPLPSTLKAVLVHSAVDLADTDPTINFDTGSAVAYGPGPDWATGYGLADAEEAVRIVRDQGFLENQLSLFDVTDDWPVTVLPGQTEVRVTLAWDDIAGTPNANDAAAQLVNDLDLTLIEPGGTAHRPLVLPLLTPRDCDANPGNGVQIGSCIGQDPAGQNYFGPAAEGTDRRNNVEQAVVMDTAGLPAGNWTARVSVLNADGVTVRMPLGGTQSYSLVTQLPNRAPVAVCPVGPVVKTAGADCCVTVTAAELSADFYDPNGDADIDTVCITMVDGSPTACLDSVEVCETGTHVVTVTVTDTAGESDSCESTIDLVDVTPPAIVCPADVTVECPADTSPAATGTASATDNCDVPSIAFSDLSVPGCGGTGTITRMWTATDASGNDSSCEQVIDEVDTTPPEVLCSLDQTRLWPPQHKFVDAGLFLSAQDACDPDPPAVAVGVTSDEHPADAPGAGGRRHCPDALVDEDLSVWLRAERSGGGDGRVYGIAVSATDACGNVGVCAQSVSVPKSMGRGGDAVDSGQAFDATSCNGETSSGSAALRSRGNLRRFSQPEEVKKSERVSRGRSRR